MNIKLNRGDTKQLKFNVLDKSKKQITDFTEIYFTLKKNHVTSNVLIQKKLSNGGIKLGEDNYYHFVLNSEDTANLDYDTYVFDIELIIGNTYKKTYLGTLSLDKEVTFNVNE